MIWRLFYRCLRKLGLLRHLNLTSSVTVNGRIFRLPIVGGVGLDNLLSMSEPWMTIIIGKLLSCLEGDRTFIDVGANIGQTLLKVKSIDVNIRYFGFEPNPVCLAYLGQLITKNNFTNTEILPVAIGEKTSVSSLYLYSEQEFDASATLVHNFRVASSLVRELRVPVFRFSDLHIRDVALKNIAIIKIDVEGAEVEVLRSLFELIENQRPFILLEVLPVYSAENEFRLERQVQIQNMCQSLGYTIFLIDKKPNDLSRIAEIPEFGIHNDIDRCDYLLSPMELSDNAKNAINNEELK